MNTDRFKFRAWIEIPLEDKAGNKKVYGFYLYYINVHDEGEAISFNEEILSDTVSDLPISDYEKSQIISYLNLHNDMVSDTFYIYKDPKYIEQCTGLKDKIGKLIYEEDIISLFDIDKGVIEWDKCQYQIVRCGAKLPMRLKYMSIRNLETERFVEVIGNIHENLELLEENKNG